MISFGTCVGYPEKLEKYARPGLLYSLGYATPHHMCPASNTRDIFPIYAGMMRNARKTGDVLVLMHDDLEFRDTSLELKIRDIFSDPTIAIAGLIGSRKPKGLAWWTGERVGRVEDTAFGVHNFGFAKPDVDTLDGMCLILSPWALQSLTLEGLGYEGFHGYADELCAQARARGKRAVVADIKAFHHSKGGIVGGTASWDAAEANFEKRWAVPANPERDALIQRIREAGTDSLEHFGNGYTHEGGLGLQQNPEELADLILWAKKQERHQYYLEIGSASGGMAKFMSQELACSVTSIDDGKHPRHGEHPILHQCVADSHSDQARRFLEPQSSFDLAFVDGDHTYEGVTADLKLVLPHAKFVAVHDISVPGEEGEGVRRAWSELVTAGHVRELARFSGKEKPLGIAVGEVRGKEPANILRFLKESPVSAQPHVMLATPAYNPPHLEFINIRELVARDLATHAVGATTLTSPGDSLVMRGRHTLMTEFLKSDCTHLLFWDVDIEPHDPSIVRQMLATGHDIVGGACPFRAEGGAVVCNIRQVDKDRQLIDTDEKQCVEVSEIGTGFLLMSRKAIIAMCEAHPHLMYFSDLPSGYGEPQWALFDTVIKDRRFLSEDYFFCDLWRQIGGKVYVYVPFKARHWGRKGYEASFMAAMGMREA